MGVPHSSAYKAVLVHRLRVAERHAFGIDILHHLQQEREGFVLTTTKNTMQIQVLHKQQRKLNWTKITGQLQPNLTGQNCCQQNGTLYRGIIYCVSFI